LRRSPRSPLFPYTTLFRSLIAALGLATVSGGFSITGMTSIFVGAFWPVIGMGIALEVGKLSAVAALPTLRWGAFKGALVVLVLVDRKSTRLNSSHQIISYA